MKFVKLRALRASSRVAQVKDLTTILHCSHRRDEQGGVRSRVVALLVRVCRGCCDDMRIAVGGGQFDFQDRICTARPCDLNRRGVLLILCRIICEDSDVNLDLI